MVTADSADFAASGVNLADDLIAARADDDEAELLRLANGRNAVELGYAALCLVGVVKDAAVDAMRGDEARARTALRVVAREHHESGVDAMAAALRVIMRDADDSGGA